MKLIKVITAMDINNQITYVKEDRGHNHGLALQKNHG